MIAIKLCLIVLLYFNLNACKAKESKDETHASKAKKSTLDYKKTTVYPKMDSLQSIQIAGHWVDIRSPKREIKGNILVLPGWSFSRTNWCENSSLCDRALIQGYRLILPEMGKSVYSEKFYPQTLKEWRKYPNKAWVVQELIPTLQEDYQIFSAQQNNFILGLSTGARGVALIALAKPAVWKACAALSGDFDQSMMPKDRLMIGYYGTYEQFPERWKGADNPVKQAKNFKTPIYLGHGKQDKIVPPSQTQLFYDILKKTQPNLKVQLNMVDAKHDYTYWDSEVENMLNFFEEAISED